MAVLKGYKEKDLDVLLAHDYKDVPTKNAYEARRLRGEATVILYSTGRLLIQGSVMAVKYTEKILKGTAEKPSSENKGLLVIGSDESLKGDTFGGMVAAAVKADDRARKKLEEIGVRESKKLSDTKIRAIAPRIKAVLGRNNYAVVERTPETYNFAKGQTWLLNTMHSQAIRALGSADRRIVDHYPSCSLRFDKLWRKVRADEKFIEVAAASVLARDAGLKQVEKLSKKAGFKLPLGSTHVSKALRRLKAEGKNLRYFAKVRFKNVKRFL